MVIYDKSEYWIAVSSMRSRALPPAHALWKRQGDMQHSGFFPRDLANHGQKSLPHLLQRHCLPIFLPPIPKKSTDKVLLSIDILEVSDEEQYGHVMTGL